MTDTTTRKQILSPSRRAVLALTGGVTALALTRHAQAAGTPAEDAGAQLPLDSLGLEHIGTVVPDVTKAAVFFSSVFNPAIYKEKQPPLRYYVTLDPGYIALGSRANAEGAFIDHDCALLYHYDRPAMSKRLEEEGLPTGRFGVIPDPDGLGFQLLGAPGGLAPSTEPATPLVNTTPLVRPRGLSHIVRYVSDMEKSLAFYRKFFGAEERDAETGGATFTVAHSRWILLPVPAGEKPRIDRFAVNVAPFDSDKVGAGIESLGGKVISAGDGHLHFHSPEGLGLELKAVDPARIWGLG
jgi:catechol 2,3-dioxygenase-like lactoylglutathione lyase family enzyme